MNDDDDDRTIIQTEEDRERLAKEIFSGEIRYDKEDDTTIKNL